MTSRKKQKVAPHQLSLRPAEEGDCELLWQWRNEENTRKWSFNADYIPYEEQKNWLLDKLNSVDSKLLINIARVIAHIKEGNEASIGAFTKADFVNKGSLDFKGHQAIEMIWEQKP